MSAELPLLFLSILATVILAVWSCNGSGQRNIRILATAIVVLFLVAAWAALVAFGVFHPVGSWGMGLGFIISIGAFFVPVLSNRFGRDRRKATSPNKGRSVSSQSGL